MSGSLQGAGGIGGLLAGIINGTQVYYSFDANGNVSDLVGTDGSVVRHYEYDPYGNTVVKSGAMAEGNPFKFSTKYLDGATGLLYYGYRYYDSVTGRWLSRDPLDEVGFRLVSSKAILREFDVDLNAYEYIHNSMLNKVDKFGLAGYGNPVSGPNGPVGPSEPFPSCPVPKPPKRNCDSEAIACGIRGMIVCGIFEGGFSYGGPWPYRACIFTYGLACNSERNSCQQSNSGNGYAN